MKLVVDVCLSPEWIAALRSISAECVHWLDVGDARATDATILEWAAANGFVVFTHDLDFGSILAVTRAQGPSVLQLRAQDVMPDSCLQLVAEVLEEYGPLLERGALVTVDEAGRRARILPLRS